VIRLFAAVLLACLTALPARADTLVVNVNGITLDDKGQPQRFAALRFGPDGKVKELYQAKDKRPKTEYQIDGYQERYFVIDSFQQLFEATAPDFTPIYRAVRELPEIEAGIVLPDERRVPVTA